MQTILGGDIQVYFLDENRQKRLKWNGTGTETLNAVYSALQDLFDEVGQMDDGIPMSAQTPVEYTIGKIDAGDADPWYISYDTMENLTSGALKTSGWTRVQDSNTGIVVVAVTSNNITTAKIGLDITHADLDAGTLLDVIEGGTTDYLVIRPDSSAEANNFDSALGTITCDALTATQDSAAVTGEQIWANLYSIGTIEEDTHIYVYQGAVSDDSRARVVSIADSTQDWWSDGHIDRCYYIKDFKTASFPVIDGGYLMVLARKYGTLYDNFEVATSITSGGKNPIPLATAPDLDNTTGYKSITTTAVGVDDFTVGHEIKGGTSLARGIITKITGATQTYTFHYYLIDDPLTDFQTAAETITDEDATGSATKDGLAPADQGPALSSWYTNSAAPSVTGFTSVTVDIDNDGTAEGYGITLNCNFNPLAELYEWIKYTFMRGNTATTNSDEIEAEQYVGGVVYLKYSGTVSGTFSEGADVTQEITGATGIIISIDTTNKEILLRDTRGTFNTDSATNRTVTDNDNSGYVEMETGQGAVTAAFAPRKAAPLGTYAGGTFFGARGVVLENWVGTDENKFNLTDTKGTARSRPQAYSITISNLVGTDETTITDDRVAAFRLTGSGGVIDKTEYSSDGTGTIGDATLAVDLDITTNTPGKSAGGILRIRDESNNNKEYRLRYSSWATKTFTLANVACAALTAGTDPTTLVSTTDELDTVKRGDLVLNITQTNAVSYVTSVNASANTVTMYPAITGQTSSDTIEINALPIIMDTLDDVFVPLIDQYASAGTAAVALITGGSPIYYRVIVRNVAASSPDGPIVPFATDDAISNANRSVATIRTLDTIYQ